MATRVASGHSGRPLAVDGPAWAFYLLLQATALLRLAAVWEGRLLLLAAFGWRWWRPPGPCAMAAGWGSPGGRPAGLTWPEPSWQAHWDGAAVTFGTPPMRRSCPPHTLSLLACALAASAVLAQQPPAPNSLQRRGQRPQGGGVRVVPG